MPRCFQLIRKADKDAGAVCFGNIDKELCSLLGEAEHPTMYVRGWYDYIGFGLATGKTFEWLIGDINRCIDEYADEKDYWQDMLKIANHLQEHYESKAWWEPKR